MKNAELKCAEKMQHLFAHNKTKKAKNKTRKKPKANYLCTQKYCWKNMHQTFAQTRTIRACSIEANLANGICNPESENKFSVAILKKKSRSIKKEIDQSDSCGFSIRLRVCVKTLIRILDFKIKPWVNYWKLK